MIVLLSPESVRSEIQRREIEYALGDPKFRGAISGQIRPTQNIPWILTTFNLLDAKQGAAKVGATIAEAAKLAPSLSRYGAAKSAEGNFSFSFEPRPQVRPQAGRIPPI
jgi:hypothetical protein